MIVFSPRGRRAAISCLVLWFALPCGCEEPSEPSPWPTELPSNREDGSHLDLEADPFYEGWYHNVVIPERNDAYFLIYGVTNPHPDSAYPSEAFLYCGRQSTLETAYQSFPIDQYRSATEHRDVQIGEHARATALRIAGDVVEGDMSCAWDIEFDDVEPWRETMGSLGGTAGLETNWTVGAIRSVASGWVTFKGEMVRFEGAAGYADHNWGTIFPREWIWLQTSELDQGRAALAASGGTVPLGAAELEAMMIGLLLEGELITFRTQDLDRITWEAERGSWSIVGERSRERITIEGTCDASQMFYLRAPTLEGMMPRAWETLLGTLDVTYEGRETADASWQPIFQASAPRAALEIGD